MTGSRKLSRSVTQSAVGLMILASLGLLGVLILWLGNFKFGNRSYKATIIFPNTSGMNPGTKVSYRGVKVGSVLSVTPQADGVATQIEIFPANLIIPRDSVIEANQSGLVGETSIDIIPLSSKGLDKVKANPLDSNCDPKLIICNGSLLKGGEILDVKALIRSTLRIASILQDPSFTGDIKDITKKTSLTLDALTLLSNDVSGAIKDAKKAKTIENLNGTLTSFSQAMNDLASLQKKTTGFFEDLKVNNTVSNLNSTLHSVDAAAGKLQGFMEVNQQNIGYTLVSIRKTSEQLRFTLGRLDPLIDEVDQTKLVKNLETISENAVQITNNVKDLSVNLNDSSNMLMLQQMLDSARSSFENIQKITSDVDELTGNPKFRDDLLRLIQGLSNLLSSTQELHKQIEYAQLLNQYAQMVPTNQPTPSNNSNSYTSVSPTRLKNPTPITRAIK
jgi:phospholipid/cholesterol/gamma-HCH transport system substrate-binding protein